MRRSSTKVAKTGRGEAPPSSREQSGAKPHHQSKSGRSPTKFTKAVGGGASSNPRVQRGDDGWLMRRGLTAVAKTGRGATPPSSRKQPAAKPHHQHKSGRSPTQFAKAIGGEAPPNFRFTVTLGHSGVGAQPSLVSSLPLIWG